LQHALKQSSSFSDVIEYLCFSRLRSSSGWLSNSCFLLFWPDELFSSTDCSPKLVCFCGAGIFADIAIDPSRLTASDHLCRSSDLAIFDRPLSFRSVATVPHSLSSPQSSARYLSSKGRLWAGPLRVPHSSFYSVLKRGDTSGNALVLLFAWTYDQPGLIFFLVFFSPFYCAV